MSHTHTLPGVCQRHDVLYNFLTGGAVSREVVHLESALTHPDYAGLSKRELAARLRAELSAELPMGLLAAISWMLGSACVVRVRHGPAALDLPAPLLDVVLDVVEEVGHDDSRIAQDVDERRRNPTLPLVRLHQTRRD